MYTWISEEMTRTAGPTKCNECNSPISTGSQFYLAKIAEKTVSICTSCHGVVEQDIEENSVGAY